ncbi:MAG: type III polyketide synthase [Bacteroidetes bacterium]|nr:type III polyketide synthase [Bacteroidota bacterium]
MLIDIATASPPFEVKQTKAAEELKNRMGDEGATSRLIDMAARYSGIDKRYIVVPDAEKQNNNKFFTNANGKHFNPDTKSRMDLYEEWSVKLTSEAVEKLLTKNKINPNDINRLITISCTGFFAPGIDYHLINRFNFPKSIKRTHIGFMGCAAALVGVNSVWEALSVQNGDSATTLLVSVEICSLHLQTKATRDNILANMIFADGAAAAIFRNNKNPEIKHQLKIIATHSILFDNSAEFMGWKIGNFGFEMMLSSKLPNIILETAAPNVINILNKEGVDKNDIEHWALHPGGRAILDSLQKGLQLSDEQLIPSREVLRNYGNMSSVSILFVLKEIIHNRKLNKGEYCCAIAFGPGLTMEVVLFRAE